MQRIRERDNLLKEQARGAPDPKKTAKPQTGLQPVTDQSPNTGSAISPADKAEDVKKHKCQRCGKKGHLEKSCWAPLPVDPANQPHQVGKGKGGGKGQEDKGKGKGKQLERSPPPPTIHPGTEGNHKCPWHQTP